MAEDAAAPPTTVKSIDEDNRPKSSPGKTVPWYDTGLSHISDASRELMEKYAHIPPEDVLKHIESVRDQAWEIHPYPCIGGFHFIDLSLSRNPVYEHILSLLKGHDASSSSSAPLLLDIGCCFGQDIRKLVYDGVQGSLLTGADLQAGFVEMGYELFRDRETIGAKFLAGDVLSGEFSDMHGTFSVVNAAAFLHLWGWEGQVEVGSRIVMLLKDETGVMVVGKQVGSITPGQVASRSGRRSQMYRHDPETFAKLWDDIGQKTGTKWKLEARLEELPTWRQVRQTNSYWYDDSVRRITFEVTRVG